MRIPLAVQVGWRICRRLMTGVLQTALIITTLFGFFFGIALLVMALINQDAPIFADVVIDTVSFGWFLGGMFLILVIGFGALLLPYAIANSIGIALWFGQSGSRVIMPRARKIIGMMNVLGFPLLFGGVLFMFFDVSAWYGIYLIVPGFLALMLVDEAIVLTNQWLSEQDSYQQKRKRKPKLA